MNYDPKRNLGGRALPGLRLVALGGTGAARARQVFEREMWGKFENLPYVGEHAVASVKISF